ncbi:hypothetical protein [Xylella fastidiosa]|uniref:hypothetical protein n=1 Tax=Xylella fastidiosa TaxID=2371 RepID=UPI000B2FCC18|nr:hypothetical protein [Xylella fastidiosa]UIX81503.1 hypothetical protein LZ756_01005 [Xylella fastidiosa subsp. sandyi]
MFGDVSHLKTQGKYNDGAIQKDQGNISPAIALRNLTLLHRRWSAIKPLGYRYQINQQHAQFFCALRIQEEQSDGAQSQVKWCICSIHAMPFRYSTWQSNDPFMQCSAISELTLRL